MCISKYSSRTFIRTHDIFKNFNPSLWGQIPIVLVGTFSNLSFNISIVWTHIYFYFKRWDWPPARFGPFIYPRRQDIWATIFQRYCCCCLFVNWTIFAYDTIVTIRIDRCAHGQCPHRRPKLTSREKANDEFMNASRVVWLGVKLREEPLKIWTRYKE